MKVFSTIAKQVISARSGDREDREVRTGKHLESARTLLVLCTVFRVILA